MAASKICLISLLFLFPFPCFSITCTPTLPCNHTIQIKPPFVLQSDITTGHNCSGHLLLGCDNNSRPYYIWSFWPFPLESISYDTKTIRVQDPHLNSSLKESGCSNLYFTFSTPVDDFDYEKYTLLKTSFSSLRCAPSNQIQSPPKAFGKDYNLSYSPFYDKNQMLPQHCSRPGNSVPSFGFDLSFEKNRWNLSLVSASYSRDLSAQPGCFSNFVEVFNCKGCKENRFHRRILIGFGAGLACLVVLGCMSFFLYKHNKLRSASSSSKLLTQRGSSDQHFYDIEIAGLQYTQNFSHEELQEATDGFSDSKKLGDGGFGTVYKGKLKDGSVVAVKRLYKNNYKGLEQFMNEVEILSSLHHPSLVTLYGCTAHTSQDLLLVFEFVPNGTVADHLHGLRSGENILTWPIRLSIAIETADALAYLHAVEPQIIHRDVKTNNILLDDGFHVKVGDFGLSRSFPLDATHVSTVPQGTPGYVDPVYHQCYQLTDKSDVYSFGVVLVELISSKPAVDMNRSRGEINLANMALNKIQRSELDELVDPTLGFQTNMELRRMVSLVAELAFRCLQSDRDMRPSIKEVLEALRVIKEGGFNGDKMEKENSIKEEIHLLNDDVNFSPDTVMDNWKSHSTTSNSSGFRC